MMYCMKGNWRVNRTARSPDFSPVCSWAASALPLPFLQGEAFSSVLWALLSIIWTLHSTHTNNSVLTPLHYSGESSATPGPLVLLGKVRWQERRHSAITTAVAIHRIIECFGLEGTFRGHLVQLPCSEQGHLY